MASGRLPVVSGRKVVRVLEKVGFEHNRTVGSHHILICRTEPVRAVSVPVHGNRALPKGTLRAILRQSGLSLQQFIELL